MCVDGFRCTGWSSHLASKVFLDLKEEKCTLALNELIMPGCFITLCPTSTFTLNNAGLFEIWVKYGQTQMLG